MFRRYPTHPCANYCDWASWYFATGNEWLGGLMVRCSEHLIARAAREVH